MALDVRLTPEAEVDLEEIWFHSAKTWSPDQADTYLTALIDMIDLIAFSPLMSRERLEFNPPVRLHPYQSHVIIYRLTAPYLDILRVVHKKRKWADVLGE